MMPATEPGQVVHLLDPQGFADAKPQQIIKTDHLRVMRLVLPAGKQIAEHKAPSEITVQCLSGRIEFTTMGQTQSMAAGQWLYLSPGEPHALKALDDSVMLVTMAVGCE